MLFLLRWGWLAGAVLVGTASAQMVVKTDTGKVRGAATADGAVRAFKGIPFAAAPVGELRWKAPQAAAKWKGVREATEFGAHCVQSGGYPDMIFHDPGESEDCLTLNVWAPADVKKGKLPVMVWIYGGGFVTGGTSERRQDGEFLARRGVVVVSMNYRLGVFGFFAHPELTAESAQHASGNYGLMDQTAALAWVRRNIAGFGGDAGNVTIFGESAGSFSVSAQMASPLAKGLFARAIGESGAAFASTGLSFPAREVQEQRDVRFAEAAFGTSDLKALRKLSATELIAAAKTKSVAPAQFSPDVDGYFLTDTVPHVFAAGAQAQVPLLAGWNADEGRSGVVNATQKTTMESFAEAEQKEFGERAAELLKLYPATTDEEAVDSASDLAGDRFIAFSTWKWLEAETKTGTKPLYRYFFALGSPGDPNHQVSSGAFHSDDIEYVFGTLDSRTGAAWRPEDRRLSEQMGAYWTNFARTGDPNGPGLPVWPKYGPTEYEVMRLDADAKAAPDARRGRYLLLDEVWGAK